MTAVEIIAEIQHLPPHEQARVVSFVRTLGPSPALSPQELDTLANELAHAGSNREADTLKTRIVAGFYGE